MLKISNNRAIKRMEFKIPNVIQRWQTNAAAAPEQPVLQRTVEWQEARPFNEMPRVKPMHLIMKMMPGGKYSKLDLSQIVLAMRKDYGEIFLLPSMLGRPATITTHNPKDFETVYRHEGIWPSRPGNETMKYYRQQYRPEFFEGIAGLLPTNGKEWGDFRSIVNPVLMQPKNVRLYYKKMSQVNREFVERIKAIRDPNTLEVPANFEDIINRWTLESVSVVALDKQLGLLKSSTDSPESTELFKCLNLFFEITVDLEMKNSPWRYIRTPKLKKLIAAFDTIKDITSGYVNEAIDRLEAEKKQGIVRSENEKSVLEKLLKVDKKVATIMAMDMLMAGVDTTSSTFVAALLALAKNPEKQEKLRTEVKSVLPEKNSEFTDELMKNVPYLRACIKESQRVYPLIVGNARITATECVLSGYRVPANHSIFMVPLTLLMNEKYYSRPTEFLPERWLRGESTNSKCLANSLKSNNPFVFLPFGFGPRMCVGKRIVDMELELGIARLIRNFKVEFNYPTENAFRSAMIQMPNIPLHFKFTDIID